MRRFGRFLALLSVSLMVTLTTVDIADARRSGGGFGSRGTRTFSAPPITRTAPSTATPIERTMTPQQATRPAANQSQQPSAARPGFFNGFGRSMLGGLFVGGLIGMLLGHGFGGGFGFLGFLLQAGLIVLAISLAMRVFRNRRQRQPAYAGSSSGQGVSQRMQPASTGNPSSFVIPRVGGGRAETAPTPAAAAKNAALARSNDEIGITQRDLDRFETMLSELQAAYGAEDYAALRRLTTPEAMSYLAEELGDNATRGLKNEVRDVHLVSGDVAEAWQEAGMDYATVAMRYESVDCLRERATGRVVSGDPDRLTETVELWTFVRRIGGDWQVSAIQSAE